MSAIEFLKVPKREIFVTESLSDPIWVLVVPWGLKQKIDFFKKKLADIRRFFLSMTELSAKTFTEHSTIGKNC
jgi:hypothetical protein